MKLLIGFAILTFGHAHVTEPICEDVIVHNIHHVKEILVENKDKPYQLAIDYTTNNLFFSYSLYYNDEMYKSAYLNLETSEFNSIPGITGGFANAVDDKQHIVYLGGNNGLYEYDFESKKAVHLNSTDHSILQMFFKNDLYYTNYPEEEVYVYKNGRSERVPELADTRAKIVALNKDLDFYFFNSSGLFKLTKSDGKTLYLDNYNANGVTADINGNLYFSTLNGTYYINENDKIDTVVEIPDTHGLAIENDGSIIYASENSIVRLKPTKTPCNVNEEERKELGNNI